MPKHIEELVKAYAVEAAEVASGDSRNWRGAERSKRMDYIKTQLASMGYDTRGQPLGALPSESAAPGSDAIPDFGQLRPGQRTNWFGADIELIPAK